ncbi:FprA family A-type flavoprotein [Desulfovibrio sp. OttesenSCG-928-C06]|nr:FprA family A-type flavoprotein [Desulfovibrio sp. OttesenSCG-928-C06]
MKPVEIKKDVFWVGAVDFGCHNFHGYSIAPRGTTYNCYLVKDEKNVLFDTVQNHHSEDMITRLKEVIEPEKIDYIVVNHLELDHAGCLPKLVQMCKPEKIFCSVMGLKSISGYFDTTGWPIHAVKTGDVVNIGKRNIHFVETRMLHWPDSMFSYIPEDKLLISNDAFGQNIASSMRFADEVDRTGLELAIEEYYYNIVLPFSPQVTKTIELAESMGLDIDMIAPDHGLIFRNKEDVGFILNKYREMAEQKPQKRALIFYDTMWHSTETLAYQIGSGLESVGVPYRIMFLKNHHHSEIMTELARCGAVIAGSPTHNNGILPTVSAVLSYMKGLRPQNRVGGAFGSFGWSGESVRTITEWLESMKMDLPSEPVKCQYRPTPEALQAAVELGRKVGLALIDKVNGK